MNDNPTHTATPAKSSRLRFSLGTMFVGLLVVALVASNLFTSWHLYHAQQTNRVQQMEIGLLRKELRFLDTSDQENVHIIALETHQDLMWKWRIFVPEGKTQALKSVIGKLPPGEFPETSRLMWLHPGQRVLTCFVSRTANGEWMQTIRTEVDGMVSDSTSKIPDEQMAWYTKQGATNSSGVLPITKHQQTISGTDKFGLIWYRRYVGTKPNQRVDSTHPSEGIVIWIEPFEEASPRKAEQSFEAPTGRHEIARGVSPWQRIEMKPSPNGATQQNATQPLCRPFRANE